MQSDEPVSDTSDISKKTAKKQKMYRRKLKMVGDEASENSVSVESLLR